MSTYTSLDRGTRICNVEPYVDICFVFILLQANSCLPCSLASFGGAGGQHACEIAHILGISTVLIHRYSSILSAYGLALADRYASVLLAVPLSLV